MSSKKRKRSLQRRVAVKKQPKAVLANCHPLLRSPISCTEALFGKPGIVINADRHLESVTGSIYRLNGGINLNLPLLKGILLQL